MKVSREEYGFKPVTITLETQDELDWLFCCLSSTSVNEANKAYADEVGGVVKRFKHIDCDVLMYEEIKDLILL